VDPARWARFASGVNVDTFFSGGHNVSVLCTEEAPFLTEDVRAASNMDAAGLAAVHVGAISQVSSLPSSRAG
jgi:hypothetical protein